MERAGMDAAGPADYARIGEGDPRNFLLAVHVWSLATRTGAAPGVPALSSLRGRPKRGVVPALMRVLTTSSPCRNLWPSNRPGLRPSRSKAKSVAVAEGGGEAVGDCSWLGSIEARRRNSNR